MKTYLDYLEVDKKIELCETNLLNTTDPLRREIITERLLYWTSVKKSGVPQSGDNSQPLPLNL